MPQNTLLLLLREHINVDSKSKVSSTKCSTTIFHVCKTKAANWWLVESSVC